MAGFSNYAEDKILDHVLRNTAFASPTTVYISLHTADPGETGANEVVGGSYARQAATFSAASGGSIALSGTLSYTSMPAVTVTHVAAWDALTVGNCLASGALSVSKSVGSGDTFTLNSFSFTLD